MMMMPMDRYSGTITSNQQQQQTSAATAAAAANTISAAELHHRHLMAGMSEREAAHAVAISSAAILDDEGDNNSTSGGDGGGGGGLGGGGMGGGGHGGVGDDDEEAEGVWAPDIEAAFQEAIQIYLPCGRRKIVLHDEGKMYGRNELIARYIKMRVGKTRTRKQVSSHIQVLARKKTRELHTKIKDPSQRDKALQRWSSMSSAQIVSAAPFFSSPPSANGGETTAAVAAAAAAAAAAMMPQHHHSHHNHHNHHNHHHAAFAAAMQQAQQQQHHPQQQQQQQASSQHLWSQPNQQQSNLYQNHHQQQQQHQPQQQHAAAVAAATAAAAAAAAAHQLANNNTSNGNANNNNNAGSWENALSSSTSGSCIASQRLRMANFWAYVECSLAAAAEKQKLQQQPTEDEAADTDSDSASCHTFMHIGGGSSNKADSNNVGNTGESLLETVHIKEIYDKFPDKKHGLKDLYEKGPAAAFFLVKCWADLNFNDILAANAGSSGGGGSTTFFGHNAEFESSEQMEITCSTKLCSFGKMMVEKVENECARFEDGRYVYRFNRSPMCEYMINLITKLKQVSDVNTMNTVLENFTILQVVSNRATGETLLCIAFVFEVLGTDEHEPQYHVYRLVDEVDDVDDKTAALYSGANNNTTGVYS